LSSRSIPRPFAAVRALLVAAVAAAAAVAYVRGDAREPFALVGMSEVEHMLSQPGVAIIDANTKQTFEKNHLPGAKFYGAAPLAQLLPADKATRLVFYCASPA